MEPMVLADTSDEQAGSVTRSLEDFIAFWCSGVSQNPVAMPGDSNGIAPDVQKHVADSYGTVERLDEFLVAYSRWGITSAVWDDAGKPKQVALLQSLPDLIPFPYRMGMNPSEPETVAWAGFFVPYFAGGTYQLRTRITWENAAKLRQAGVPLEYARALDTPSWDQMMSSEHIIAAYRDGLAPEYARELLYGAVA